MKKVLSIVLSIAMVICLMPAMAFAGTASAQADAAYADTEGLACEGAVNVLSALGVVSGYEDGSYKPAGTVTRAEMAKLIVTALGLADYATATTSRYSDMGGAQWAVPYVEYASNLGIINGYGNGKFGPSDTVTYEQACTMIVRALGYTTDCKEMQGEWPAVYVQKARALGIFDEVSGYTAGTGANRGDIAIMLNNALDEVFVYVDADGVTRAKSGNPTMMQTLNKGGSSSYGIVTDADADNAAFNIRPYVGAAAKIVTDKAGKVIAIDDIKTVFLTGDYDAADKTFTVGDTEYKINVASVYTAFRGYVDAEEHAIANTTGATDSKQEAVAAFANGEAAEAPAALEDGNTYTIAATVDGKTITGVYSIATWTRTGDPKKVTSADITILKEKDKLLGQGFAEDKNGEIDTTTFALEGVSSLDEIKANDIVEVFVGATSTKITKVAVGTEVVTGKVSKISGDKYTVNGTAYKKDARCGGDEIEVGNEYDFRLTASGKIFEAKLVEGTTSYAVVIATGETDDAYGKTTYEIKLLTADGAKNSYIVDADYADDEKDKAEDAGVIENDGNWDATVAAGAIVKYGVNASGKVDSLEVVAVTENDESDITKNGYFAGKKIAAGAPVFTFDNRDAEGAAQENLTFDNAAKKYGVASIDSLLDTKGILANYVLKDNQIVAMIISDAAVSNNEVYGVVTEIADIKEGDYKKEITLLVDGKEVVYKAKSAGDATVSTNLYKVEFDTAGNISTLTAVDAATATVEGSEDGIAIKNNATAGISFADSMVIYTWNATDEVFEVGYISDIETADAETTVSFYALDDDDNPGLATVALVAPTPEAEA